MVHLKKMLLRIPIKDTSLFTCGLVDQIHIGMLTIRTGIKQDTGQFCETDGLSGALGESNGNQALSKSFLKD